MDMKPKINIKSQNIKLSGFNKKHQTIKKQKYGILIVSKLLLL